MFSALTDFHCRALEPAGDTLGLDRTFFSTELFDEFFAPYYGRIIDTAHSKEVIFWLRSCGHIGGFLSRFIDLRLNVLHPIQKYTMDEAGANAR